MNNFKDRLVKSSPVWSDLLDNNGGLLGQQLVDGAAAGDLAVSGIKSGDVLIGVIDITNSVDLTSEFTITGDAVINNTGGTSSAAAKVLVTYEKWQTR